MHVCVCLCVHAYMYVYIGSDYVRDFFWGRLNVHLRKQNYNRPKLTVALECNLVNQWIFIEATNKSMGEGLLSEAEWLKSSLITKKPTPTQMTIIQFLWSFLHSSQAVQQVTSWWHSGHCLLPLLPYYHYWQKLDLLFYSIPKAVSKYIVGLNIRTKTIKSIVIKIENLCFQGLVRNYLNWT